MIKITIKKYIINCTLSKNLKGTSRVVSHHFHASFASK